MGVGPKVEGHSGAELNDCASAEHPWLSSVCGCKHSQGWHGGKLDLTGLVKRKFYFPAIIAWGREGE